MDFEALLETLRKKSEERRRLGREVTSEKQSKLRGEKYYMKGYRFYTNGESETRCLPEDAPGGWRLGRSDVWKEKHSRPRGGTKHVKCLETNEVFVSPLSADAKYSGAYGALKSGKSRHAKLGLTFVYL
jgi:hypothetical protein